MLAEPLFWLLTQLHKILGNWGWSIVGLVVLLKIAFYWLNAKAYGSMAKMKAVNPKIDQPQLPRILCNCVSTQNSGSANILKMP